MRATLAALAAIAALAATAPGALADHDDENLPWPQALPPQDVPTSVQPRPVRNCRRASVRCLDGLLRRLRRQWEPLDAACDHRALWPLAYIRITEGLRADLARRRPRLFRYPKWFIYVITDFSNRYFKAFDAYNRGRPVPEAWRITFDAAARGDANGGQDVLLASNAHTQYDLPHVYAKLGMRTRGGASRKHDHDAVNAVNTAVFDGLEDEFAERYDPFFNWIDMKPLPFDEIGTQEGVKAWREGAWRNAERLMNARTPEERARVEQSIAANSVAWAHAIADPTQPGYRAVRDAHCRAYHAQR